MQPRRAAVGQAVLGDPAWASSIERGSISAPSTRLVGKRFASSTIAHPAPQPEVQHAGACGEPRAQGRETRQHDVDEDPRQRAQAVADLLDERVAVVLVRDDPARAQAVGQVRVVLAAEHQVDPRRPTEVERRVRVAQDGVQVRRHPPAVAVALEELEREGGPAQDVRVVRVRPQRAPPGPPSRCPAGP